jgi:hypothetical protein
MNKYFFLSQFRALLMLSVVLIACKTAVKTADTAKADKPAVHKYFTIDNGPCFGRCAVYEISFLSDSTIRMNGKSYVNYQGHYFKKLTQVSLIHC